MLSDPAAIVATLFWAAQSYIAFLVLQKALSSGPRHPSASWVTDEMSQWALVELETTRDKVTPRPDLWAGRYLSASRLGMLQQRLAESAARREMRLNCTPARHKTTL